MTPTISVSPGSLTDGGTAMIALSGAVAAELSALQRTLEGCGGMCGDDPAGVELARAVDATTKAMLEAIVDTANGASRIGDAIKTSAANHDNANSHSHVTPGAPPLPFPAPTPPVAARIPPTSEGGSGEPFFAKAVESLVGMVCPNGHQDMLRAAAGAWRAMAGTCRTAAVDTRAPSGTVDAQRIPEAARIDTALTTTAKSLNDAAATCVNLAGKLEAQADLLDKVHQALRDLVSKLASPSGIVGGLMDLVTGDDNSGVAHDIETVIGNFGTEVGELAHLLAPYAEIAWNISKSILAYAGMQLHNVAADLVNAAASFANAIRHDPLRMGTDIAMTAAGAALTVLGGGGEVLGAGLDVTGVGAVLGVPVNVVSAGVMAAGASMAGGGAIDMSREISGHWISPMAHTGKPGEGVDRGDGRDPYGHITGREGGAYGRQPEAEGIQQYQDRYPGRWVTTERRLAAHPDVDNGRYFDGLAELPDGTYEGIEVKSGNASRDAAQRAFDNAVSPDNPAYVTITTRQGQVETVKITQVATERVAGE